MPEIKNVPLDDGLKANLPSISQLCDEELHVEFDEDLCRDINKDKNVFLLEPEKLTTAIFSKDLKGMKKQSVWFL